ncbi:MAG: hypothetical protein ACYTHM_24065, partial [Planctomycetota bacterium]
MGTQHKHRVCTFAEAEEAIRAHDVIYVSDCDCRASAKEGKSPWEYCGHELEVCMGFRRWDEKEKGPPQKEIPKEEVLARFEAWKKQGHFFRLVMDEDWLCFCCSCGCGCFRDKEGNRVKDSCDKSPYTEKTDEEACSFCGDCVEVCA